LVKALAVAKPIPAAAPVTSATFPLNVAVMLPSLVKLLQKNAPQSAGVGYAAWSL